MPYLCECRGPCRRVIDITHETYRELRLKGTVVTADCARREARAVVHEHDEHVVVVFTVGSRVWPIPRPPRSL